MTDFVKLPQCRVSPIRWVLGLSLTPHCVPCVGLLRFSIFDAVEKSVKYSIRTIHFWECLLHAMIYLLDNPHTASVGIIESLHLRGNLKKCVNNLLANNSMNCPFFNKPRHYCGLLLKGTTDTVCYVSCSMMSLGYRHPSGVSLLGFSLRNRRGRTLRPRRKGSWEARWSKEERSWSTFSLPLHLHSPTNTVLPSSDSETTSSSMALFRPTVPHQRLAGRNVMPSMVISGMACRQRCSHMFAT